MIGDSHNLVLILGVRGVLWRDGRGSSFSLASTKINTSLNYINTITFSADYSHHHQYYLWSQLLKIRSVSLNFVFNFNLGGGVWVGSGVIVELRFELINVKNRQYPSVSLQLYIFNFIVKFKYLSSSFITEQGKDEISSSFKQWKKQ